MKIKSIKLTSELEIMNNKYPKTYHIGCQTYPIYQVEYEETTPTGLIAKGTMELKGDKIEEIAGLFDFLESDLTKDYSKKEIKDEKVDCKGERSRLHNAEIIYPYAEVRKAFEENFNSRNWKSDDEPNMPFDDKPENDPISELAMSTALILSALGVEDKIVDKIKILSSFVNSVSEKDVVDVISMIKKALT